MTFNKQSQRRIANVVRQVERTPYNEGAGKRQRRQPPAVGSRTLRMTLLHDDFETETQEGDPVNCSIGTGDDIKYYNVLTPYAQGKYWEGDLILASKVGQQWFCMTDGYTGGRVQLNSDMTPYIGTTATADILPSATREIEVVGYHDFAGLKSGHNVICVWSHNEFVITDIEDRIALGTTDGIGDYDAVNSMNWNILNGSSVVGVYKSGQYIIIGAACN